MGLPVPISSSARVCIWMVSADTKVFPPPTCHFLNGPSQPHEPDVVGGEGKEEEVAEEVEVVPEGLTTDRSEASPAPKGDPVTLEFRKALKTRRAMKSHMPSE